MKPRDQVFWLIKRIESQATFSFEDVGAILVETLFSVVDAARAFGSDVTGAERKLFVLETLTQVWELIAPKIVLPALPVWLSWSMPLFRRLKPLATRCALRAASGAIESALVWIKRKDPSANGDKTQ